MGHKTTYVRRKREAQCYNGEKFERKTFQEDCECTEEDWECDVGYARSLDGPCLSVDGDEQDFSPPEKCQGSYIVSQGYRKIAGDTCNGGVDHAPLVLPCPGILMMYTEQPSYFYSLIAIAAVIYLIYQGYLDNLLQLMKSFTQSSDQSRRQPRNQNQPNNYEKIDEEMQDVESFFEQEAQNNNTDTEEDDDETIKLGDSNEEENTT